MEALVLVRVYWHCFGNYLGTTRLHLQATKWKARAFFDTLHRLLTARRFCHVGCRLKLNFWFLVLFAATVAMCVESSAHGSVASAELNPSRFLFLSSALRLNIKALFFYQPSQRGAEWK